VSSGFACGLLVAWVAGGEEIKFNRDVRPILAENCFVCHGPDKNNRKGKLRLDVREVALERGAIVPGKPGESKLVANIFSTDPEETMPPPKSHKTLSGEQKELLRRWVAAGAKYEPHWAYIKPERFPIPSTQRPGWVRTPVDAFIMHTLELKGIQPSREADRATLLRRLSLDLVGLPPTLEEVQAFVEDKRPDAYARQVERLLASPHFGERMAVPWLDVVRYADTVGYHGDQNQNAFPYRDYVIDSFNRDKPFDQFTIEQVAGDLLPNPSTEARTASCFNRLNMVTREGGAQPKEYLAKYAADRVRTVSMAWLGSTMGCAECHDHKYDPFTSRDFYSMEAFFADLKQWGVYSDYSYTPNPDLAGFDNDHPFPPEMEVESPYLKHRIGQLRGRINELAARTILHGQTNAAGKAAFRAWCDSGRAFFEAHPSGWVAPEPRVMARMKETNAISPGIWSIQSDGTVVLDARPRESLRLTIPLTNTWLAAIRLEIVPLTTEEPKGNKKRKGGAVTLAASVTKGTGTNVALKFAFAEADLKTERYVNGFTVLGVADRWQISTEADHQTAVWLLDKPMRVTDGQALVVELGKSAVASVRISYTPFPADEALEAGGSERLRKALGRRASSADDPELLERTWFLTVQPDLEALAGVRRLEADLRECRRGRTMCMVSATREPLVTRVLARGNWQDETGEIVQPAVPRFLSASTMDRRLTRLDLAKWLVSRENPLTARTVVNRLWKQFFGNGLSAVVDDLGAQGEWPVHPELLDWLACEFMEPTFVEPGGQQARAWDFKHLVRVMVLSSVYRQDSNQRPDLKEVDPNNRLLACQSPRRLEAEFVRDNALAIAGLLNADIGGPSAHPYQPAGYYANLQFPDRDYRADRDERQYRRGVYSHWQRTFLQPMLANFDAPSREECVANRNVSNTPQQALTLLNDPTFVEASRVFAERLLEARGQTDGQRLEAAFRRALARKPSAKESQSLLEFLAAQREHGRVEPEEAQQFLRVGLAPRTSGVEATELAAWAEVCRVILNLHETITKY